jgi:hypothetical protein
MERGCQPREPLQPSKSSPMSNSRNSRSVVQGGTDRITGNPPPNTAGLLHVAAYFKGPACIEREVCHESGALSRNQPAVR